MTNETKIKAQLSVSAPSYACVEPRSIDACRPSCEPGDRLDGARAPERER
jgi:hypothetical protein